MALHASGQYRHTSACAMLLAFVPAVVQRCSLCEDECAFAGASGCNHLVAGESPCTASSGPCVTHVCTLSTHAVMHSQAMCTAQYELGGAFGCCSMLVPTCMISPLHCYMYHYDNAGSRLEGTWHRDSCSSCAAAYNRSSLPVVSANIIHHKGLWISCKFLYQWSVNWCFVPESIFLSRSFATALLGAHLGLLFLFSHHKWCTSARGMFRLILLILIRLQGKPFVPQMYSKV